MDNSARFDDKIMRPPPRVGNLRRNVRYTIAAAATLVFLLLVREGYEFYSLSSYKLYVENYSPYELTTSGGGADSVESKVEKAYREKNYVAIIRLNANSALSVKDVFLTGISYLETDDMPRAISNFQVVIADVKDESSSLLRDAAEYYLALAYIRNNDYDQAIELMNSISNNSSHLYTDKFGSKFINKVKRLKWR